jgi:hypothetical protein
VNSEHCPIKNDLPFEILKLVLGLVPVFFWFDPVIIDFQGVPFTPFLDVSENFN